MNLQFLHDCSLQVLMIDWRVFSKGCTKEYLLFGMSRHVRSYFILASKPSIELTSNGIHIHLNNEATRISFSSKASCRREGFLYIPFRIHTTMMPQVAYIDKSAFLSGQSGMDYLHLDCLPKTRSCNNFWSKNIIIVNWKLTRRLLVNSLLNKNLGLECSIIKKCTRYMKNHHFE